MNKAHGRSSVARENHEIRKRHCLRFVLTDAFGARLKHGGGAHDSTPPCGTALGCTAASTEQRQRQRQRRRGENNWPGAKRNHDNRSQQLTTKQIQNQILDASRMTSKNRKQASIRANAMAIHPTLMALKRKSPCSPKHKHLVPPSRYGPNIRIYHRRDVYARSRSSTHTHAYKHTSSSFSLLALEDDPFFAPPPSLLLALPSAPPPAALVLFFDFFSARASAPPSPPSVSSERLAFAAVFFAAASLSAFTFFAFAEADDDDDDDDDAPVEFASTLEDSGLVRAGAGFGGADLCRRVGYHIERRDVPSEREVGGGAGEKERQARHDKSRNSKKEDRRFGFASTIHVV